MDQKILIQILAASKNKDSEVKLQNPFFMLATDLGLPWISLLVPGV